MKIVEEISMKCTRKQYESIMHLVGELTASSLNDFVWWEYLTNHPDGTVFMYKKTTDCISYDTFDKDIFLKACGIETPKIQINYEKNCNEMHNGTVRKY